MTSVSSSLLFEGLLSPKSGTKMFEVSLRLLPPCMPSSSRLFSRHGFPLKRSSPSPPSPFSPIPTQPVALTWYLEIGEYSFDFAQVFLGVSLPLPLPFLSLPSLLAFCSSVEGAIELILFTYALVTTFSAQPSSSENSLEPLDKTHPRLAHRITSHRLLPHRRLDSHPSVRAGLVSLPSFLALFLLFNDPTVTFFFFFVLETPTPTQLDSLCHL